MSLGNLSYCLTVPLLPLFQFVAIVSPLCTSLLIFSQSSWMSAVRSLQSFRLEAEEALVPQPLLTDLCTTPWTSPGLVLHDSSCSRLGGQKWMLHSRRSLKSAKSWVPSICCPWHYWHSLGYGWPSWLPGRLWLVPRLLLTTTPRSFSAALRVSEYPSMAQKQALELSEDHLFKEVRALWPFLSTRNLWPNNCDEFLAAVFPLLGNRKVVMTLLLNTYEQVMITVWNWDAQQGFLLHTVLLESY